MRARFVSLLFVVALLLGVVPTSASATAYLTVNGKKLPPGTKVDGKSTAFTWSNSIGDGSCQLVEFFGEYLGENKLEVYDGYSNGYCFQPGYNVDLNRLGLGTIEFIAEGLSNGVAKHPIEMDTTWEWGQGPYICDGYTGTPTESTYKENTISFYGSLPTPGGVCPSMFVKSGNFYLTKKDDGKAVHIRNF